jgi:hypothetical protein
MTEIEENKANVAVDVDNIIERLLEVRGTKPGQQVQLAEHEIRFLCSEARAIFIKQPILLELEAPIKVCKKNIKRGKKNEIKRIERLNLVNFYNMSEFSF